MINIEKGRYWDLPWSLVSSCTRCSSGCDHCWSLAMEKRFKKGIEGKVEVHPERLSVPLKRKKPAVYAIWNDLFHEDVPDTFIGRALSTAIGEFRHTFLVLTKRPQRMADLMGRFYAECDEKSLRRAINVYCGLTVCNQQEADEKIPIFLQVPGKKFLSIEPMLEDISLNEHWLGCCDCQCFKGKDYEHDYLDAVILGGETGPGARPMSPDWARRVRDQCEAAGVPFFFKSWGEWAEPEAFEYNTPVFTAYDNGGYQRELFGDIEMVKVGKKAAGRILDGRTYDDLPWVKGDYESTER